jgi:hypothetical protein
MLVIDAATLYPRYNRGESLYALDVIDRATIKPLIGEDGRAPEPPDPAYQQILKAFRPPTSRPRNCSTSRAMCAPIGSTA